MSFWGTVKWLNGIPASGVEVRFIGQHKDHSEEDLTTQVAVSDREGIFTGKWDLLKFHPATIDTTVTVGWKPRDPRHGDFTWVPITKTVRGPDPTDIMKPFVRFRYTIFGQTFEETKPSVLGQTEYHLSRVGHSGASVTFGVANGFGAALSVFYHQQGPIKQSTEIQPGSNWTPVSALSGNGYGNSVIKVVQHRNGGLEIFVQDGGNIFHRWQDNTGGWSSWDSLGGNLDSNSLFAVAVSRDRLIHVFGRKSDGSVCHIGQNYPTSPWGSWESLGGVIPAGANLAAGLNPQGVLELFVQGTDGAIWHKWQSVSRQGVVTGWSDWASLGGQCVLGPLAVSNNSTGGLEVFVLGLDGALWHIWQDGQGRWAQWNSLGGLWIGGCLSVVRTNDGLLHVFVNGTDRAYWYRGQTSATGQWGQWTPIIVVKDILYQNSFNPFIAGKRASGELMAFVLVYSEDNPLYGKKRSSGGVWGDFEHIGVTSSGSSGGGSGDTITATNSPSALILSSQCDDHFVIWRHDVNTDEHTQIGTIDRGQQLTVDLVDGHLNEIIAVNQRLVDQEPGYSSSDWHTAEQYRFQQFSTTVQGDSNGQQFPLQIC